MSYNEDAQPNEVRHTRKGNAQIPAIRSSHSIARPGHSRYDPLKGEALARGHGRGAYASSSNAIAISRSRWGAPTSAEASGSREGEHTHAPPLGTNHKRGAWKSGNQEQYWGDAERGSMEPSVSSSLTVKHEVVNSPSGIALEPLQVHSHPHRSLEKNITQSPSRLDELDHRKSPTSSGSTWLKPSRAENTHNSALFTHPSQYSASGFVGSHPDTPKDNDIDGVCWGRWEALSNPPRFRSGTFMLSLPRPPLAVGENPPCAVQSAMSRDVDGYGRIARFVYSLLRIVYVFSTSLLQPCVQERESCSKYFFFLGVSFARAVCRHVGI